MLEGQRCHDAPDCSDRPPKRLPFSCLGGSSIEEANRGDEACPPHSAPSMPLAQLDCGVSSMKSSHPDARLSDRHGIWIEGTLRVSRRSLSVTAMGAAMVRLKRVMSGRGPRRRRECGSARRTMLTPEMLAHAAVAHARHEPGAEKVRLELTVSLSTDIAERLTACGQDDRNRCQEDAMLRCVCGHRQQDHAAEDGPCRVPGCGCERFMPIPAIRGLALTAPPGRHRR